MNRIRKRYKTPQHCTIGTIITPSGRICSFNQPN
uniref:Uncharacterized protein n=1 Tax=Anguilla anguilla TaxID=7936 RepID=A0A0E9PA16_ANGAN